MFYFFLTVAFLLELVAFVSFAFSSAFLPINTATQIIVGSILFIALILFWSRFMAPKAAKKFSPVPYYVSKSIIYAIAASVLFTKVSFAIGSVFVMLSFIDEIFLYKHNLQKKEVHKG